MGELEANDPDDDEKNRDQANDVVGVAKEENSACDCARSSDASPNGISGSDGDCLHRLGDGEKAQHDENHRNDARDQL